ncbi:MAG: DUF3416 domain-containing protein, partial [Phycisphaerales bacterium]|nr:DUF3416 domain-containing protein [Phycisphaerales bacterium]
MAIKTNTPTATAPRNATRVDPAASVTPSTGSDGRARVIIEAVAPTVPDGPFAAKRSVGETARVEADIFCDGHDAIAAVVRHRKCGSEQWTEVRMAHFDNDRWAAEFDLTAEGACEFVVEAWVDHFATWQRDLRRRAAAGQDLTTEYLIGAALIEHAIGDKPAHADLRQFALRLRKATDPQRSEIALDERLTTLMAQCDPRRFAVQTQTHRIWVDRERARFSSWYELFPRSTGKDERTHGTFRDVIGR